MHSVLTVTIWACFAVSGLITVAAVIATSTGLPVWLQFLQANVAGGVVSTLADAKIVAPVLIAVAGVLNRVRAVVGPPWLWRTINALLDHYRDQIFPNMSKADYRLTLFRRSRRWRVWPWRSAAWPWGVRRNWRRVCPWRVWTPFSGWLSVAQRSGAVDQSSGTVFLASRAQTEGVAGQAWKHRIPIRKPDVTQNPITPLPSLDDPDPQKLAEQIK